MNLESRGGLGWLDGFNELVVRCGYEWTGHPGIDNGVLRGVGWEMRTDKEELFAIDLRTGQCVA